MAATLTRPLAVLAVLAVVAAPAAQAQDAGCQEAETNMQCNELGSIAMAAQGTINGAPLDITTRIVLERNYQDQNARSFLFSVRNVSSDGPSIATLEVTRFTTPTGDIAVSRTEHPTATEIDMWVDVLDVPVGQPIELTTHAGASDKGAYRLEVLVQPFDKDYHTFKDSLGSDASLFSFTLLIVSKASGAATGSSPFGGKVGNALHVPGVEAVPALAALLLVGFALRREKRGG
ncbi:MAG: hypothetical protein LC624_04970 [Halobacteriales archaeon]|nr:hypothetical protein [Halobacteriales archaeon]